MSSVLQLSSFKNIIYLVFTGLLLIGCGGGGGGGSANDTGKADTNTAPSIQIGGDLSLSLDDPPAILRATVSDDGLPSNTISVEWQVTNPASASAVFSSPNDLTTIISFSEAGQYTIQATVSDGELSASDNIVISVVDNNTAPVVDAGQDQLLIIPDQTGLLLSGSYTDDTDLGQPYVFSWQVITPSPGNVVIDSPDSLETNVSFSEAGIYEFALTVSDGRASGTDYVVVTVEQNLVGTFPRPQNTTCVAPNLLPLEPSRVTLEPAFPSLLHLGIIKSLKQAPGDNSQWYAMSPTGRILQFINNPLVTTYTEFLNIEADIRYDNGGQLGLLGIAFHPDYQNNGQLFLHYTAEEEIKIKGNNEIRLRSIISRFTNDNGAWSEEILLKVNHPELSNKGGNMEFGPDGYLYIGLGDGGGDNDPSNHAQNPQTILGSMLRIDVDNGNPYSIPADNPYSVNNLCNDPETIVNNASCPEVYAYGFRKPNQFSFDLFGTDLWSADSGQISQAEVNKVINNGNYGWNIMEGSICRPDLGEVCDQIGLTLPVYDYTFNNSNENIMGGFVYRGNDVPFLRGQYVFADSSLHKIFGLVEQNGQILVNELADTNLLIYGIGQSLTGELYVLNPTPGANARGNNIFKLVVDPTGTEAGQVAANLSETGCVDPANPTEPTAAMIEYDVISQLWTDNAEKKRFFAIPDGSTITVDLSGDFAFPVGSVLMKHFILNGEYIETRLLMYHPEGWLGYSYEWQYDVNGFPVDAVLLDAGKTKVFSGQNWHYPSRQQCLECHTAVAGRTLGLETLQLNREFTYPVSGIYTENQLLTYEQVGLFSTPLDQTLLSNKLVTLDDVTQSFEIRSKSYLHSNCAYCHQPGGALNMDMRFQTPFTNMGLCNVRAQSGDMGLFNPLIIDPTGSYLNPNSVLPLRMEASLISGFRMPPLGTELVDVQAVDVIKNWINDLSVCP